MSGLKKRHPRRVPSRVASTIEAGVEEFLFVLNDPPPGAVARDHPPANGRSGAQLTGGRKASSGLKRSDNRKGSSAASDGGVVQGEASSQPVRAKLGKSPRSAGLLAPSVVAHGHLAREAARGRRPDEDVHNAIHLRAHEFSATPAGADSAAVSHADDVDDDVEAEHADGCGGASTASDDSFLASLVEADARLAAALPGVAGSLHRRIERELYGIADPTTHALPPFHATLEGGGDAVGESSSRSTPTQPRPLRAQIMRPKSKAAHGGAAALCVGGARLDGAGRAGAAPTHASLGYGGSRSDRAQLPLRPVPMGMGDPLRPPRQVRVRFSAGRVRAPAEVSDDAPPQRRRSAERRIKSALKSVERSSVALRASAVSHSSPRRTPIAVADGIMASVTAEQSSKVGGGPHVSAAAFASAIIEQPGSAAPNSNKALEHRVAALVSSKNLHGNAAQPLSLPGA
jgi:hypothetical protein